MNYSSDVEAIDAFVEKYKLLKKEVNKVIIGQDEVVKNLLICIFSKGHGLLVGVPGLAKTLMVNTISKVLGLSYSRIQFTPDLMPSDIVGTEILDETRKFRFIKGPIFANIILADEINRTPPKTQSALLEAMQEKAVTVAGNTYPLSEPFFVLATQNPIEQEGTYPLPEAQLDRFMFNIWLDYPSFDEEINIVKLTTARQENNLSIILTSEEILYYQNLIQKIPVADNVFQYAVKLASKTRPGTKEAHRFANDYLTWGAGPRASQYLIIGAKCNAVINGKYSPDIEDVKAVAVSVLRHRIVRNYKAEADGIKVEKIIEELVK
ncbi:MAG TPA: MoxR family ATPase [Bacteroidales bacterium]|nr:MoxR family ATPase [Bacteroidales bacterium]